MVKTAEKDVATSPESPFFDPPCGYREKRRLRYRLIEQETAVCFHGKVVPHAMCPVGCFPAGIFYWQEEIPRFTGLEGASALRAVYAGRNIRRLYKMDVPPC